jgi:ubiquinone/menaquinone biosynthesis C-methylase UbiE
MFRPGGTVITQRMVSFSGLLPGSRLMDVGCGDGSTVRLLMKLGYDISGIDVAVSTDDEVHDLPVYHGTAFDLPCRDSELDGILCECVFSLLDSPSAVITEFKRALKPEGALMMSDLYSHSSGGMAAGMMKNIYTREGIERFLGSGNFSLEYFEDSSEALKGMFAQLIFDMGANAFFKEIDMDFGDLKKLQCGYFLLVARPLK